MYIPIDESINEREADRVEKSRANQARDISIQKRIEFLNCRLSFDRYQ